MYTRVSLRLRADGYLVDFDTYQWQLVSRVTRSFLDGLTDSAYVRLLLGEAKDEVLSLLDRFEPVGPVEHVRAELSPHELHVLHAMLTRACLGVKSEEAFYRRYGFFVENVRDLAFGIENALTLP
ncbi:hypothetical protein WEI85_40380 [Actinomycetes bacterium KLBMP 9797]